MAPLLLLDRERKLIPLDRDEESLQQQHALCVLLDFSIHDDDDRAPFFTFSPCSDPSSSSSASIVGSEPGSHSVQQRNAKRAISVQK